MTISYKILNQYECTFRSDKGTRHISVAAKSFGEAAMLAYSVASKWEDCDAFELKLVHLENVVATR